MQFLCLADWRKVNWEQGRWIPFSHTFSERKDWEKLAWKMFIARIQGNYSFEDLINLQCANYYVH